MKPIRMLVAALALIGLSACYTSDAPLVTDDTAAQPFQKITFINPDGEPLAFTLEGKAYKSVSDGDVSWLHLQLVEGDYYVAQITGEDASSADTIQTLYGYMQIDRAQAVANMWKIIGDKKDVRPGLRECKDGICIDDLQAYIDYAKEGIAAGNPPDMSMKIEVTD